MSFQSTLPIQGETFCFLLPSSETVISIHSPYTGRDGTSAYTAICLSVISIHSPYTGRDARFHLLLHRQQHFNPLSLYRERQNGLEQDRMEVYFNPLSLYRERQCDRIRRREWQRFQSTLPIQGETVWRTSSKKSRKISIHSPYTGRDLHLFFCFNYKVSISIHSPYTGRDFYSWL